MNDVNRMFEQKYDGDSQNPQNPSELPHNRLRSEHPSATAELMLPLSDPRSSSGKHLANTQDGPEISGPLPPKAYVEAFLFASSGVVEEKQLRKCLPGGAALEPILRELQEDYRNRGVTLCCVGKSWAFRTDARAAAFLTELRRPPKRLPRSMLETLSVILYRQPITRNEIEQIRGVAVSGQVFDRLLDEGWIRPLERKATPGRPYAWGVTEQFYDHFGITGPDAIPNIQELQALGALGPEVHADAISMADDPDHEFERSPDPSVDPDADSGAEPDSDVGSDSREAEWNGSR